MCLNDLFDSNTNLMQNYCIYCVLHSLFMRAVLFALVLLVVQPNASLAGSEVKRPDKIEWHFDGMLGKFDRESIQRGFKVYKEVCAACHSVKHLYFRNLEDVGFTKEEVKAIAAGYTVVNEEPDEEGEMLERPGESYDRLPDPFPNTEAAKASNNGAEPPDLTLIVKARKYGADYIYALLNGYTEAPIDSEVGENMSYNPYFDGGQLSMPPPLPQDGMVEFDDGTEATMEQMSYDVVNFLQWAAEPEMEERKSIGLAALLFIVFLAILMFAAKKAIWFKVK